MGTSSGEQAQVGFDGRPQLSPQEELAQAQAYIKSMEDTANRVRNLIDQARREKDIIRLNCVTDKLLQINANITNAKAYAEVLKGAVLRNDAASATTEFNKVGILQTKVDILAREAEGCVGQDPSYVGRTRVDLDIDPSIPTELPTNDPSSTVETTRPLPTSPSK